MNNDNRLQYSKYRLEKAQESLNSATINLANQQAPTAVNRAYYCIFHSIRAILALDGFDSKKHSGIIEGAFNMRNDSDYTDFFETTMDVAREHVKNARFFLSAVEAYLKNL
jgi:uncharacterized protein (UPF0332 family)